MVVQLYKIPNKSINIFKDRKIQIAISFLEHTFNFVILPFTTSCGLEGNGVFPLYTGLCSK